MGYIIDLMQTVLETWQFVREAERIFTEAERESLISYISVNPLVGVEIVGSGGLRKLRFAIGNKGKSGGARVIYFFYSVDAPIYLIACFAKNERENLSAADIRDFAKLTAAIKDHHRSARR
ncbi:type II toxin-antitoxin system RelE/ParE family toxin [Mesorhizobium australicum]|uniref:RelE toxin of RelE / RelB toxin-antitoxin system n=1 Tax=Mesorhizobium australicum TaxID=536018 RepID=A0A1X7NKJ0_9HYPH|nr:type II toxin-antitoxin system RelE/ParE family toxin [Mesorhizobium australicum]SMH38433.1 RelE toxin of RelE / RelB toxin-antitoxin system [Mesorhizobium australicum]